MYQKYGLLTNHGKKYNYIYCNTMGLLYFLRDNCVYKKSFLNLLHTYNNTKNRDIFYLVIDEYRMNLKNNTYKYLLIYNANDIISSSRVYYNKIGIIELAYTNKKYRNNQFCQKNIKKIMKLTNKKFKINKFELNVDVYKLSAIKCYKNCGFIVKSTTKQNEFIMQTIIK